MDSSSLTVEFQQLYQAGESLESVIQEHLNNWPLENGYLVDEEKLPQDLAARVEELRDRAHKWFNQLTMQVLPRTTFERSHSNLLLRRINAAIGARKYAHALGKRPILYRRSGTSLHFDLSIHNVPEYENVTQLRTLLRQRLEAITGRVPPGRDV